MQLLDVSKHERIRILLELVAALSRAHEPREVLREFSAGMVKLRGPFGFISLSCRGLEPGQYRITRLLSDDNIIDISRADPWRDADQLTVHDGGLLGEIVARGEPALITDLHLTGDPALGDAIAEYRSLIATPLFDNGEPLNWSIQLRREPNAWTADDLEDALLRSNLVGNTVRHVQTLKQLRTSEARMQAEVQHIASIQRALLPELPSIPGVSIAASYETFDHAGGDFYAFRRITEGTGGPRWAILIGDVSGHGPAAAVVMAMVSTLLAALPESASGSPAEALSHLNLHLCSHKIEQSFVTAFLGFYEPANHDLVYSSAGHPPPVWRRVKGEGIQVQRLADARGLPLGIMSEATYANASLRLGSGDTLALFTDGITESRNPDDEFFEVEGVERALRQCSGEPSCLIDTLRDLLRTHEAGDRPADDQTLLAMQIVDGEAYSRLG